MWKIAKMYFYEILGSPWRVNVSEKADGLTETIMDSSRQQQESSDVMMIRGDPVRHVRFGKNAVFEINAPGFTREAVDVSVLSKLSNKKN